MRKLEPREVSGLLKVTQLVNGRANDEGGAAVSWGSGQVGLPFEQSRSPRDPFIEK